MVRRQTLQISSICLRQGQWWRMRRDSAHLFQFEMADVRIHVLLSSMSWCASADMQWEALYDGCFMLQSGTSAQCDFHCTVSREAVSAPDAAGATL